MTAFGLHRKVRRHPALIDRYVRAWARGTLRLSGVRVHLEGEAPPRSERPRLVVANHRSALDVPLLLAHFGGCVLSKAELESMRFLGTGASLAGCIFVDRDDPRSGTMAMREIRSRLQDGRTVCVFPEGTTFEGDELRPLNRGALVAARGLDVELVLAGIAHPPGTEYLDESFEEHVANFAARPRLDVGLALSAPLPLVGPAKAAIEGIQASLQALVHRARARIPGSALAPTSGHARGEANAREAAPTELGAEDS